MENKSEVAAPWFFVRVALIENGWLCIEIQNQPFPEYAHCVVDVRQKVTPPNAVVGIVHSIVTPYSLLCGRHTGDWYHFLFIQKVAIMLPSWWYSIYLYFAIPISTWLTYFNTVIIHSISLPRCVQRCRTHGSQHYHFIVIELLPRPCYVLFSQNQSSYRI